MKLGTNGHLPCWRVNWQRKTDSGSKWRQDGCNLGSCIIDGFRKMEVADSEKYAWLFQAQFNSHSKMKRCLKT